MCNFITNVLTINGTEEEVAKVRNFIKGPYGDPILFQSFIPMPSCWNVGRRIEIISDGKPITVPDWEYWRMQNWGTWWEADPIFDDDDNDNPNRIVFSTVTDTPRAAITTLSKKFPEITFNVIFSDDIVQLYCGEYTIIGGMVTNKICYDAVYKVGDISVDCQMEYYFLTHEYDRNNWEKNEEGEWCRIHEIEDDETIITKTVKHTHSHHRKNSSGMKLLWHPSTKIKVGEYSGMTFGDILKFYGKKAFPELLKHYRISKKIMKAYHCTLKPHVEKPKEMVSVPVLDITAAPKKEEMTKTNETDQIDRAA